MFMNLHRILVHMPRAVATTGGSLGGRTCMRMLSCSVVSDSETLWTV